MISAISLACALDVAKARSIINSSTKPISPIAGVFNENQVTPSWPKCRAAKYGSDLFIKLRLL